MLDMEAVAVDLVKALRGSRSQRALSRRLQYTTNVVYLWEKGRRWPTAATFFWLAHRVGKPLELGEYGPEALPAPLWKTSGAAAVLRHTLGDRPARALADQLGVSRHVVGRWLRAESEPRLPDFLRAIEVTTTRVLDFVALFVDPSELESTSGPWRRLGAARAMTREQPWAPAVLLALELEDYQSLSSHDDGWLADRLGISELTVVTCMTLLADAGQIRRTGSRWRRVEVQSVDTRVAVRAAELKRWWLGVALERFEASEGVVSFSLSTVSEADFVKMRDAQILHYRAMRALIGASEPGERVVLMTLSTLGLDESKVCA